MGYLYMMRATVEQSSWRVQRFEFPFLSNLQDFLLHFWCPSFVCSLLNSSFEKTYKFTTFDPINYNFIDFNLLLFPMLNLNPRFLLYFPEFIIADAKHSACVLSTITL